MSITRLAFCASLTMTFLLAESNGPIPGVTGAPGDGLCTDCHAGTANSGPWSLQIRLASGSAWIPGQQLKLIVTLADPTAKRWGFELTARSASNTDNPAGTLALADATLTRLRPQGPLQFVTHTATGTRPGTSGSSTWEVLWTPPDNASFGDVVFFAAGNAANGDGTNSGDKIYTTSLKVSPGSGDTTPATVTRCMPRFVFGGGSYAALYLYNTTANAASVAVTFTADNGTVMALAPGGGSTTVNLNAAGSAVIEAQDGPITQGYATLALPPGVTGYGVLRQPTPGQGTTETIVSFAGDSVQSSTLAWDETSLTTLISLANPGVADITVTLTLRDSGGATLATSSLTVAAKTRAEFNLKDRPEFTMVAGIRGTLAISTQTGNFAAAAFRTGPQSLAAIPTTDK